MTDKTPVSETLTNADPRATMRFLAPLAGTWRGTGHGHYPTIEAFEYFEELSFAANGHEPLMHYVQKTWTVAADGTAGDPLHSESGFLRATEGGVLEISNAQNGGRVEVLRGQVVTHGDASGDGLRLEFDSVLFGHDERMSRTRRTFVLQAGVLRTVVEMATRRTPELQSHVEAVLTKTW